MSGNLAHNMEIRKHIMATTTITNSTTIHSSIRPDSALSLIELHTKELKEIAGFTLEVVRFRDMTAKDGSKSAGAGLPAMACYLPDITSEVALLLSGNEGQDTTVSGNAQAMLLDGISTERQNHIRTAILTAHTGNMKAAGTAVDWSAVSVAAMLAQYTAATTSARLTKEAVETWFNAAAMEAIATRVAEVCLAASLDVSSDAGKKKAAFLANNYKGLYMRLAATVPNIQGPEANTLLRMLEQINSSDNVAVALHRKLTTMLNPVLVNTEL